MGGGGASNAVGLAILFKETILNGPETQVKDFMKSVFLKSVE